MILPTCYFMLPLFIQYSYPNQVQGKISAILLLAMLACGASLPLIAEQLLYGEHTKVGQNPVHHPLTAEGWKLYQNVLIGISVGFICLTGSLILLAFDKEALDKASKLIRAQSSQKLAKSLHQLHKR